MVDKSLELLVELNKERESYIYKHLVNENRRHLVFEKENEFLEFIEKLANIPAIKLIILETLKNKEIDEEVRKMACLLGFNVKSEEFYQEVAEIVLDDATYLDTSGILSLLDDEKQETIIKLYLRNIQFKKKVFINLGEVIFNNAYFQYAESYIKENKLVCTKSVPFLSQAPQAMLAMRGDKRVIQLMESEIDTLKEYKKYGLAIYLILAKSQKAFDYAKVADYKNLLGYVTRFGSPADLESIKASINRRQIGFAGQELFWYGNPKAIPWYIESLNDKDIETREIFHKVLLDFFDEESELREEGEELLDFDEDDADDIPSIEDFQSFWNSKKEELSHLNYNQRYLGSKIFDMQALWDYERYSDRRGFVADRRNLIMIWTGEYFAFDRYALISKQLKQYKVIEDWLEEHKNEFKKGRWYRWGKDITDEIAKPTTDQEEPMIKGLCK